MNDCGFTKRVEKMKPRGFWEHYNGVWEKCAEENPNVVSVKYDDMMNNFKSTMAYIASRFDIGFFHALA